MEPTEDQWAILRRGVARGVADAKRAVRECMAVNGRARMAVCEAHEAVATASHRVASARARLRALKPLPTP